MKKLMKYVKPQMWYIILTLAIKFIGTYAELWIPSFMETMLDEIVPTGNEPKIYSYGGLNNKLISRNFNAYIFKVIYLCAFNNN